MSLDQCKPLINSGTIYWLWGGGGQGRGGAQPMCRPGQTPSWVCLVLIGATETRRAGSLFLRSPYDQPSLGLRSQTPAPRSSMDMCVWARQS